MYFYKNINVLIDYLYFNKKNISQSYILETVSLS
jgi:hypothetical protein